MARFLERERRRPTIEVVCRIGAAGAALAVLALPAQAQRSAAPPEALADALGPAEAEGARRRAAQARVLAALQAHGRDPPPALLVPSRSALDAARAAILLNAMRPEIERRAAELRREAAAAARLTLRRPVEAPARRLSRGLAYRTAPGAPVVSPLDGRVAFAGPLRGWGGVLILSGPGGYHVVLAGMEAVVDAAGRPVAAGDPVGRMASGSEGGAQSGDRPELYLEVRRNGAPIDPARFLNTSPAPPR